MKANILNTIKASAAVPSVPQVVLRFLEIMQDPNFEYRNLVRVLSADPGTVSEVLRLANSALFGVRNKVVSLQQALTLLGPKRTRSLLLGRYLVDSMSKKAIGGLNMSYFWRRSLASSVVSSHFAQEVLPKYRDETSIGSLLADIGIPILAEAVPELYQPIIAQFKPNGRFITGDQEHETVDVNHAEVSAMVLQYWKLPDDVVTAVNLHQSAEPGDSPAAAIARILNASDRIAKLLCEIPDPQVVNTVCVEATAFAGTNIETLIKLLPTIEQDIEELAEALRIDVIPSQVYALVANTIEEHLAASATK